VHIIKCTHPPARLIIESKATYTRFIGKLDMTAQHHGQVLIPGVKIYRLVHDVQGMLISEKTEAVQLFFNTRSEVNPTTIALNVLVQGIKEVV
jgi:hypothetical protein